MKARCRGTEPSHRPVPPQEHRTSAAAGARPMMASHLMGLDGALLRGPCSACRSGRPVRSPQEHRTSAAAPACASGANSQCLWACYMGIYSPIATGPHVPPAPSAFFPTDNSLFPSNLISLNNPAAQCIGYCSCKHPRKLGFVDDTTSPAPNTFFPHPHPLGFSLHLCVTCAAAMRA